jgi:hypothetical protein
MIYLGIICQYIVVFFEARGEANWRGFARAETPAPFARDFCVQYWVVAHEVSIYSGDTLEFGNL